MRESQQGDTGRTQACHCRGVTLGTRNQEVSLFRGSELQNLSALSHPYAILTLNRIVVPIRDELDVSARSESCR